MIRSIERIDRGAELVIGSRTSGKAEKGALLLQAKVGNYIAVKLLNIFLKGYVFTDLGPFRGVLSSSLYKLNMRDKTFGWTVEMQGKAILAGLKCAEVSVSYKKRIGTSKITGTIKGTLLAGYHIISMIFKLRFLKNV